MIINNNVSKTKLQPDTLLWEYIKQQTGSKKINHDLYELNKPRLRKFFQLTAEERRIK